jgi:hypothetical protein
VLCASQAERSRVEHLCNEVSSSLGAAHHIAQAEAQHFSDGASVGAAA